MHIVAISYASELDYDEIDRLSRSRSDTYRNMTGLLQKYYIHDRANERYGGIYVFESATAADALFESDIHDSLRDTYAVTDIDIQRFDVMFPLYEDV